LNKNKNDFKFNNDYFLLKQDNYNNKKSINFFIEKNYKLITNINVYLGNKISLYNLNLNNIFLKKNNSYWNTNF
jgi:hypothetical protein